MKSERTITITEVAERFNVSSATVRNWLKAKRIKLTERSLRAMEAKITRGERLAKRANKLHKIEPKAQDTTATNWSDYALSLSESHRNREGIYYTPQSIAREMILQSVEGVDLANKTFLDPCCGCGNFLVEALELGFRPENIYGYDIDNKAIEFARKRLPKGVNLECRDFLQSSPTISFDYIFTNPPWGKHIDISARNALAKLYNSPSKIDSSVIFMCAIFERVTRGGVVGLLMPESFFNIGAFEWGRKELLKRKILSLTDFRRPFKGLMTRAQAVVVEATKAHENDECRCRYEDAQHLRRVASFGANPKSIINFWANNEEAEQIERIFAKEHITLAEGCRWGLGIVTGDNERHCTKQPRKGYIPLTRGVDITPNGIAPATIFASADLALYQQHAPREIYEEREKLIYRFISKRLIFAVDREGRYLLNSANALIIDKPLTIGYDEVAQLLNSEVMNWLYTKLFRSRKILRKDIERLPIHIGYFTQYKEFNDLDYARYLDICFYQQQ